MAATGLEYRQLADFLAVGVAVADSAGRQVYVNPHFARMLGWEQAELVGQTAPYPYWPSDELENIAAAFRRTLGGNAPPEGFELRFQRRDGSLIDVLVQVVEAPGEDGASLWLASVTDISQQRQNRAESERRLRDAGDASDRARRELEEILEGIGDPFVVYTPDWRFRYVNRAAAGIFAQFGQRDVLGRTLWELFPDLDGSKFGATLREAAAARKTVIFEEYRAATSSWAEVHCFPMPDGGVAALWKNTTERKRAEEALHYLAETGRLLTASLDWEETVGAIARAVVPQLADWCTVTVVDDRGELRHVALTHADPERVRWAEEFVRRYPPQRNSPTGAAAVIRTGRPELISDITDDMLVAAARDAEHLRLARELELRSAITVPLIVGDATFGALTLVSARHGRRYTEADLDLAMEIGRRAALAVEHARLYRESETARTQAEDNALELELQADELRRAREVAEQAAATRSGFLATMSHELRTPINAIIGYTELLQLGVPAPIPEAAAAQVQRIQRASRHLLSVIDEILTFSRLEAGREHVDIGDVDLVALADEVTAVIEPLAIARGLRFSVVMPEQAGFARTDARKVRQILVNLLGNAVKFTDAGTIEFEITPSSDNLALHVRDTGKGIAADQLENIFDAFHQLDNGNTRQVEGSGLGLAVSRRLARLLGGDVEVRSAPGVGSEFIVRLPVR